MRVEAEAKLNLCLAIKGTDGNRHIIDSIFVPAGIKDIIYVEKSEKTSVSYTDGRKYERDTAAAVAEAVSRRYGTGGARILIEKRIPEGAGLGGSSADAGAVARALDALYRIGGIDPRLLVSIGSDVPYFYFGGAARVSGTGEVSKGFPVSGDSPFSIVFAGREGFFLFAGADKGAFIKYKVQR